MKPRRRSTADKAAGRMPDRPLIEADFTRRRALMLPEAARYDVLLKRPKDGKLGAALTAAMEAVEAAFPPLAGQLPKDYERFEDDLLERMLRMFDSEGAAHGLGRRVRPHLRVLPRRVLETGRARQRRVLHATLDRADHRQCHRARPRHRLRSGLRLGRHVRAVEPFHRGCRPGHDEAGHLLWPREERDDRQASADQPRRSRPARHDPGRQRSHHLLQGPARTGRQVRFRHGQSALQRGRGRCGEGEGRQAPAVRPAGREQGEEGLQRQLPLAVRTSTAT